MSINPRDTVIRTGTAFSHPRTVARIVGKWAHFVGGGKWPVASLRKCPENEGYSLDMKRDNCENSNGPHQLVTGCGPKTTETRRGSDVK